MNLVFGADGLKVGEGAFLQACCNHTDDRGYVIASMQQLADEAHMGLSTARTTRARLEERQLLKTKERFSPKNKAQIANLFRVNLDLLAKMQRQRKDYGPTLIEELTFAAAEENPSSDPPARIERGAPPESGGGAPESSGPPPESSGGVPPESGALLLPSSSPSSLSPVSGDADASAGTSPNAEERDAAAPKEPSAEAVASGASKDDADVVVDAYAAALRRPLLNGSRKALRDQAMELLAAGLPVGWVADRAREMAARPEWKDLVKHCDRSKVPVQGQGGESAALASGLRMCRKPGHGGGAFPADDCSECRRESRPRRDGASRVDTSALIAALHSRQNH